MQLRRITPKGRPGKILGTKNINTELVLDGFVDPQTGRRASLIIPFGDVQVLFTREDYVGMKRFFEREYAKSRS